ncbi:MAG: hypothetical protein ACI9SX_001393 [Pseudoalteromonas tetraodonis]|jgi:hypothetical protein
MRQCNTVLNQILKIVPRHEFKPSQNSTIQDVRSELRHVALSL